MSSLSLCIDLILAWLGFHCTCVNNLPVLNVSSLSCDFRFKSSHQPSLSFCRNYLIFILFNDVTTHASIEPDSSHTIQCCHYHSYPQQVRLCPSLIWTLSVVWISKPKKLKCNSIYTLSLSLMCHPNLSRWGNSATFLNKHGKKMLCMHTTLNSTILHSCNRTHN